MLFSDASMREEEEAEAFLTQRGPSVHQNLPCELEAPPEQTRLHLLSSLLTFLLTFVNKPAGASWKNPSFSH